MSSNYRLISPLTLLVFFSVPWTSNHGSSLYSVENEIENVRAQVYRLVAKETFKFELLLLPVPVGIATMVDLMVMTSTLNDYSLKAHQPPGGFKLINYPESFHASLEQVSFAAHGAFLRAHINMNKISIHVKRMFDNAESIQTIFKSGERQGIVNLIPKHLRSIKEAAAQCSELSKEVVDKFIEVTELTEEVTFAVTALKGGKGKLNIEAKKKLNLLKLKKEESEKMLRELEISKKKIEAEAADAYERVGKTMDEMPGKHTAESKLKAAKDQLAKIREEVDKATLQRQKEREEQFRILTEMSQITFDATNYETAMDTLTRGMDNLTQLYRNWIRLQEFFGKIESFIGITVVKNVEDLHKWSQKILSGEMKITSSIKNRIAMTTTNVDDHLVMVYHAASIYGVVSSNYIMAPLYEWSRISDIAGKSKDAIEANRKKLLKLCTKAEFGIKKVLESEEGTCPAKRKAIGEQQKKNDEL